MNYSNIAQKVGELSTLSIIGLVLLAGTATASIAVIVSNTSTGDVTVNQGFDHTVTQLNGEQVESTNSFSTNLASGGEFTYSGYKENLANEKTEPLVGVTRISSESGDLDWKTLENVTFYGEVSNQPSPSTGPSEGTQLKMELDVHPNGDYTITEWSRSSSSNSWSELAQTSTENYGYYFGVTDTTEGDILICVGDSVEDTPEGGEGSQFNAGEKWDYESTVDTQSGFPEGTTTVDMNHQLVWNPTTGQHPDTVANCPQYSNGE
jgi:hypothetical protein